MAKETKSKLAPKATATRTKTAKKPAVVQEPVGRYINPLTDFGFKHIFGTKEFLIDFLNAILNIEEPIVELHYDNTVRPGRSKDDRTTIFDLYCTLGNHERIIIEMQHHSQDFFRDRVLYYASRLIQEQGEDKKGDKKWEFKLKPVYSVNITNFKIDKDNCENRPAGKYISYVQLYDRDTFELFYRKLTFVFLELPYFTKEINELSNDIDGWTYILNNLMKLDHLPEALQNQVFEQLFTKAEIAKLSRKERKEYDQSLKNLRDMNVILAQRDRKIADMSIILTQRDRKIAEGDAIIATLSGDIATLSRDNATLSGDIATLSRNNADKDRRIAELERILTNLSSNQREN